LFTGYTFIHLECLATHFATIRSTRGVQKMLKFGEWWATVDNQFIEYLKYKENGYRNVSLFKADQEVIINDGPFKGVEAVYLCANGDDRAMVLLTLLGRQQTVAIDERLLRAV
jgi:transcriptional antiterminator RfaH